MRTLCRALGAFLGTTKRANCKVILLASTHETPAGQKDTDMALRVAGKSAAVEKHTDFDIVMKKDGPTLRATTHDGKKFLLATVTSDGLRIRPRNNHPDLGVRVATDGKVRVV